MDYTITCAGTRITIRGATLAEAKAWGNHVARRVYDLMLASAFKVRNGTKTMATQVHVRDDQQLSVWHTTVKVDPDGPDLETPA